MWSANQWSVLGIEATTDISKIKAAYARKAKLVHPEEYPEEFQELQKAYKSAMKYAKMQNTYKTTVENKKTSSDRYILQDISDAQTMADKEIVSKAQDIEEKEKTLDEEAVFKPDNIVREETISNKNEVLKLKDISERETISDKGVIIDDELEFVYDEISYEEKSQQCILDMICLAKNIYLINDIRCWEWFFSREEYKELYQNDEFRLHFVETIRQIFGWTRKTLLYIEAFLKTYQKEASKPIETNTIKWKILKRPKLFDHMKAKQSNVTNAQKKVHDIILAGVKNNGYLGNINDHDSFLEYIRIYLNYAHNNIGRVEDLYQSGRNSTHILTYIYAFVIVFIILMLYGLVSGRNYQQTEQEKRVEKWDQERLENIQKWNQERLEKLKAEKESIRQLEENRKESISSVIDEMNDIIK